MLQVQTLTKLFRGPQGRRVLDQLDLELAGGEYVAIMGASGSGKSTLLNVLGGLLRPDGGRITLEGIELGPLDDATLTRLRRRRIGFVFQAFHLLPHLDAAQNIALPLQLDGVPRGAALARAQALLERVGLADRGGALPGELSGGEVQRVAVARALAHQPALVLADEPTGNLDHGIGLQVLGLLREQLADSGGSGLLVTHSLEAARTADRILVLQDGRLHPWQGETG
jgi:putative ABC transport system ATP-binding protein